GSPVHIGSPHTIGIQQLDQPDFGDPVTVNEGEVPVFWACGVTPQAVAMNSKPEMMITHAPGHMFITDLKDEQFSVLSVFEAHINKNEGLLLLSSLFLLTSTANSSQYRKIHRPL